MTNILVTSMLLTGGAAAFNALTGVPTPAACFLLPLGVIIYTMFGGIKATFLTDYVHTLMLLIIIIIFSLTAYATSDALGSPKAVYDLLQAAAERHPVSGNAGGSYLTMRSSQGMIFFIINIVGNFGTVSHPSFSSLGLKSDAHCRSSVTMATTTRPLPLLQWMLFQAIFSEGFRGSQFHSLALPLWALQVLPLRVTLPSQPTRTV